uniref:Mitotic spindle checkpoint protein MAD2 n=2 Tax=Culex pipiens TaxID=7175 RepID=A0A8D8J6J5_CULPI
MSVSGQRNVITLSSSAALLVEYMDYAINMVLYQRDVCPRGQFVTVSHYGMPLFVSRDYTTLNRLQNVLDYIQQVLPLLIPDIKVYLTLKDRATGRAIERWQFLVQNEDLARPDWKDHKPVTTSRKNPARIQEEIRQTMKQITASISCLPVPPPNGIDWTMAVDVPEWVPIPPGWYRQPLDPIDNPQQLGLRPFSTGLHQMQTVVTYREEAARER